MRIAVVGVGNIGTTLINILSEYKEKLSITKIYAIKHILPEHNQQGLDFLREKGVEVIVSELHKNLLQQCNIQYVFDCSKDGIACSRLDLYDSFPGLKVVAQGSEKGFGVPFMLGINEQKIIDENRVQVVSCNTHGALSILHAFTQGEYERLNYVDFVAVRRSEDISQHRKLINGTRVARHLDQVLGTHHAVDVVDTLATLGVKLSITSSDVTTPSTLFHTLRFSLCQKMKRNYQDIIRFCENSPYLSTTKIFDANVLFDTGRRYGKQGRIFSHSIVVENNLLINGNILQGWAFIPQEGNTILSTIAAFLFQTNNENKHAIIQDIANNLLRKQM